MLIDPPPMESNDNSPFVILRLDKDPQQCDEVVRNMEEYRNRPLTTPDFLPQPGQTFDPDKHIKCTLNQLKQLVKDLCFHAGMWRADETLSAATADWSGRNTAVFLQETVSPDDGHPGWLDASTMAAKVYCHVLEELVADIIWFQNEGNRVFNKKMNSGRRHTFKSHMALHASAVFVSPVPTSDQDLVYHCEKG